MTITIVGLGLIGGSLALAAKQRTTHTVWGIDRNADTCKTALARGAVDQIIQPDALGGADLTIVCLYPEATVDFVLTHADALRPGAIVLDACGVKEPVVDALSAPLRARGVVFIGAHPMAGREFSGIQFAKADLFDGASFLLTPPPGTPESALVTVRTLAAALGFGKTVETTPRHHDTVIAYTSQLAHLVSNAYAKSPTLAEHAGYSAGSFLDLTRVAKMNEAMWTSLFLANKTPLLQELDWMLAHLAEYRDALAAGDGDTLRRLITIERPAPDA